MSFLSYLINGISLGSVYAIIALGYTMVYGIARMLNFAHGDIIMVGGFVIFTIVSTLGLPPMVGVLAAVIACTVLGVVIERVAYKPLRGASSLAVLITAIGVSYLLQNVALLIFGSNARQFTSVVNVPSLKLAGGALSISGVTMVTIITCIIIMAALTTFINKTKVGQAMLAVSEDTGAATLMGINVNSTIAITFAIAARAEPIAGARDRFCPGSDRGRTVVLRISVPDSLHRFHAGYQGVCGSCFRRHRLHSGRADRRYFARSDRESFQSIYFFPAF